MKKKMNALLASAILATSVLGSTAAVQASETEEVVIWCFVETHAQYFEWVTEEYTKEHPEVTFRIEVMDNDSLIQRLTVVNAAGGEGSPDLIDVEQGTFPRFMSEESMIFEPLTEYIERDGLTENLVESRLSLYTYNGDYYGLEHALCPVTMAYRADLFEEYGLEVPTTWEEYKEAAAVFAENGIYITADNISTAGMAEFTDILSKAAGADFVGADGQLNITDVFKDLVMDNIEMQANGQIYGFETDDERWSMTAQDKVATFFLADWAAGWLRDNVPEQSGKWQLAALPKVTEDSAAVGVADGTGLCMSMYTKQDKEMLWDFMKFAQADDENAVVKYEMVNLYPPVYGAMEACNTPVEYYDNQNLGELWQSLADEIPVQNQADWRSTFTDTFKANAYDLAEGNITIDEMADILTEAVEE